MLIKYGRVAWDSSAAEAARWPRCEASLDTKVDLPEPAMPITIMAVARGGGGSTGLVGASSWVMVVQAHVVAWHFT